MTKLRVLLLGRRSEPATFTEDGGKREHIRSDLGRFASNRGNAIIRSSCVRVKSYVPSSIDIEIAYYTGKANADGIYIN